MNIKGPDFNAMAAAVVKQLETQMKTTADNMAVDMRQHLQDGKHIDTGQLINSISTRTENTGTEINAYIDIGAESENGAWYAEFLEFGTGIYNESGNGRQSPWQYKDRKGNWHTTQGMEADPFIRPSVAAHIGELEDGIKQAMDLKRYKK